jgi:hypothetical protein
LIPLPEIQIFGGGAHAGRRVDVQDLMVVSSSAQCFAGALEATAEAYRAGGRIIAERGLLQGVADEGGWWPAFSSNEQALDTLMTAIERAGLKPVDDVAISLDVAASEFGRGGRYRLGLEKRDLDRDGLAEAPARSVDPLPRGRALSAAFASTFLPCLNRLPAGLRRRFRARQPKRSPRRAGAREECRCASTTSCWDRARAASATLIRTK